MLVILESLAKELQADVKDLPESLVSTYSTLVDESLGRTVEVLREILEGTRKVEDGKPEIYAELLVGRISLFLARHSTFLEDLTGRPTSSSGKLILSILDSKLTIPATIVESLISLHADSTSSWRSSTITSALSHLSPLFDLQRGPREVKATWQGPHPISPSASILVSLNSLVKAVRYLGIPPDSNARDILVIKQLVEGFVDAAKNLDGWNGLKDESCVQATVDLGFLCLVRGGNVGDDRKVQGMMQRVCSSFLFAPC
jgi:hypothetical protein